MERITSMSKALEMIEQVGETPFGVKVNIQFDDINWDEVKKFAKQEDLELFETVGMKGYFYWVKQNCFTFWNSSVKSKK